MEDIVLRDQAGWGPSTRPVVHLPEMTSPSSKRVCFNQQGIAVWMGSNMGVQHHMQWFRKPTPARCFAEQLPRGGGTSPGVLSVQGLSQALYQIRIQLSGFQSTCRLQC